MVIKCQSNFNPYVHTYTLRRIPCGVGRHTRPPYLSILTYIPCFIHSHFVFFFYLYELVMSTVKLYYLYYYSCPTCTTSIRPSCPCLLGNDLKFGRYRFFAWKSLEKIDIDSNFKIKIEIYSNLSRICSHLSTSVKHTVSCS